MSWNETTRRMPRTTEEAFKHCTPDWSCAVTRFDRRPGWSWKGVGLAAVLLVLLLILGR